LTQDKKQSRGKLQREKKRKQREGGAPDEASKTKADAAKDSKSANVASTEKPGKKAKLVKPPKKQKVDKEEETFSNLVETYKQAFAAPAVDEKTAAANKKSEKKERRWFE
jgi:hypothetical protein